MRKAIIIFVGLFFTLSSMVLGEKKRSFPSKIEDYWKEGEELTYKFYINDTLFGAQTTTLLGKEEFEGQQIYRFKKNLNLDLAKIHKGTSFRVNGEMLLTEMGKPVSYGVNVIMDDKKQHIEMFFFPDSVKGSISFEEKKQGFSMPFDSLAYLADYKNDMIGDFYIILNSLKMKKKGNATLKIFNPKEFKIIEETIYVEKALKVKFAGQEMEISVYNFTVLGQSAWVTKDRKIIRWIDKSRNLTIDLDMPTQTK
jgi:hypothetical protein